MSTTESLFLMLILWWLWCLKNSNPEKMDDNSSFKNTLPKSSILSILSTFFFNFVQLFNFVQYLHCTILSPARLIESFGLVLSPTSNLKKVVLSVKKYLHDWPVHYQFLFQCPLFCYVLLEFCSSLEEWVVDCCWHGTGLTYCCHFDADC